MAKKDAVASTVKVRILLACHVGKPNDVIEVPAEVAADLVSGGFADSSRAAVDYAESLK